MNIIEKLPWYDDYTFVICGCSEYEKEIEELENPEKQLQRIKKFYADLGADYSKNELIMNTDKHIAETNSGENSRLAQLKREVKFGEVLKNAVNKQDDDSINAMLAYQGDDRYARIIKQIMFYLGVSKIKHDPGFIQRAYKGIESSYPLDKVALFIHEGVYYYIYYFQCLRDLLYNCKKREYFNSICNAIADRCFNVKLKMGSYRADVYLSETVGIVIDEIIETEKKLREIEILLGGDRYED